MNSATTITLKDLLLTKHLVKNLKIKNNSQARVLTANNLTKTVGRGMEYAESRLYQPGDDSRHIDWRVTARNGKTYTKLFHEEKGENNYIVLDLTSSLYFGTQFYLKSVIASRIASFVLWLGFYENNNIGGIVFNQDQAFITTAKQTKNNLWAIFNKIVEFHDPKSIITGTSHTSSMSDNNNSNTCNNNLLKIIQDNEHLFKRHSRIYIISDFLNTCDALNDKLIKMNYKNLINLVKVSDPIEKMIMPCGIYNISNGYANTTIHIDKTNQSVFKDFFNNKLINYNKLIKHNIKHTEIFAEANWYNPLYTLIQ